MSRIANPCGPRLERNRGRLAGLALSKYAAIALSKSRNACC
jgi:hypothetical protein